MLAVLALGFATGMQHALEADHVAAVSSLISERTGMRQMARHGAIWGLGHTLVLMLVGGAAVVLGVSLEPFSNGLEFAVGVMLMLLGAHVLYRLARERVHLHSHRHEGKRPHFHAHSHKGESKPHAHSDHDHTHPDRTWVRPFVVGVMHGLAGTAAVVVLTAAAQTTPAMGLLYIAVFGAGSLVGMVALTSLIALPMSLTANALTWLNRTLQAFIGIVTIGVGAAILGRTALLL